MNEPQQAELLSRWLASGARGEPPAGLDADTVATVYALRPDLAPTTRVTADDILASVMSGPFAESEAAAGGQVVPFPVPPSRPESVAASAGPASTPAGRRTLIGAGLGLLAAAAAAALVLSPQGHAPPSSTRPESQVATTAAVPAAPAAPIAEVPAAPPPAPPADTIQTGATAQDATASQGYGQGGAVGGAIADGLTGAPADNEVAQMPRADLRTRGGSIWDQPVRAVASPVAAAPVATPAPDQPKPADASNSGDADDAVAWDVAPPSGDAAANRGDAPRDKEAAQLQATTPEPVDAGAAQEESATHYASAPPTAAKADRAVAAESSAPVFDASAVLADADRIASSDPVAAAHQLQPYIGQGTVAEGQRIALAAARYARDAGQIDLAETLAKAGLARGGSGTADRDRLSRLIAGMEQARVLDADQAAPAATAPAEGNAPK